MTNPLPLTIPNPHKSATCEGKQLQIGKFSKKSFPNGNEIKKNARNVVKIVSPHLLPNRPTIERMVFETHRHKPTFLGLNTKETHVSHLYSPQKKIGA